MDLKKWEAFQKLDPIFAADIKRAFLIGLSVTTSEDIMEYRDRLARLPWTWSGGLVVMRNGDVYSIVNDPKFLALLGASHAPGDLLPLVPEKIPVLCGQEVKAVSSGIGHVVVSCADGRVYQWGCITIEAGNSCTVSKPQVLSAYLENKRVTDFACGQAHTVALTEDGQVYAWGNNLCGLLGNGTLTSEASPVKISESNGFDSKIVAVACGAYVSFALDSEGNVWSWGNHNAGVGYVVTENQVIPKKIELNNIKKIAVGPFHALALSNENEAYFWGTHGTGDVFQTPTKVSVQNVVDIAAANGCYISALKTTQGKVYFWGFAYGIPIPKPVLTNFTSMEELFSSLDTPQMLKPVESDLERPRLEKLGLGFDDRETGDIKFRVGRKLIYAHKTVLKLCSDHFRKMFDNGWKENHEDEISLESSGYTYEGFRTFLQCLYTDRIEPPPRSAQDAIELFKLANYYVEEELKRRCEQQLKVLTTINSVCEVYSVAVKYSSKALHDLAIDFIIPNLNAVLKTEGYKNMEDDLQKQLIQDLVKEEVFVGLERKRKRPCSE